MTIYETVALVPALTAFWIMLRCILKIFRGEAFDRGRTAVAFAALNGLFVGFTAVGNEALSMTGWAVLDGSLMLAISYLTARLFFGLMDVQMRIWRRITRK